MKKIYIILIIITLIACNSKPQKKNTITQSDENVNQLQDKDKQDKDDIANNCNIYEPELCKNPSDCHYVYGHKFNEQQNCYEEKTIAGCALNDMTCTSIFVKIFDTDGNCWSFSNDGAGCIPSRWTVAESGCGLDRTIGCYRNDKNYCNNLTQQECSASISCREIFSRIDDDDFQCLERVYAGCITDDSTCNEAVISHLDAQGICHLLSDSCIPLTFTATTCFMKTSTICENTMKYEPCDKRDYDECIIHPSCIPVYGQKYNNTNNCFESKVDYMGCSQKTDCVTSEKTTLFQDEICWLLEEENSCIPSGERDWKAQDCHVDAKVCEF